MHLSPLTLAGSDGKTHTLRVPFTLGTDLRAVARDLCAEHVLGRCDDLLGLLRRDAATVLQPTDAVWTLALQRVMADVAADHGGEAPVFVQAGAMDGGGNGDPIYSTVTAFGWRGVVVEPLPRNFRLLQAAYAAYPGVVAEHAAITATSGTTTLVHAPQHAYDSGQMSDALNGCAAVAESGSFDRQRATFEQAAGGSETTQVPAISLSDLVAKHGLPRLDVLQVDTEGSDWLIVQQVAALPEHMQPRVVRMEFLLHTSAATRQAVFDFFLHRGYELHWVGKVDLLAVKPALRTPDANVMPSADADTTACTATSCEWLVAQHP